MSELFKPIHLNSENLNSLPITNGQLIFSTDDKKIYLDMMNNRTEFGFTWDTLAGEDVTYQIIYKKLVGDEPTIYNISGVELSSNGDLLRNAMNSDTNISIAKLGNKYSLEFLNTGKIKDFSKFFRGNRMGLFMPEILNIDTKSATNMSEMFYKSIWINLFGEGDGYKDITINMDTSKVSNMTYMFYESNGFVAHNRTVNFLNTSNVKNMKGMFQGLGGMNKNAYLIFDDTFNISNVKNMRSMFFNINSTIGGIKGIENWDVSKVTDFVGMFSRTNCNIDSLEKWNFSSGTDFTSMFYETKSSFKPLINIENVNLSKANSAASMVPNWTGNLNNFILNLPPISQFAEYEGIGTDNYFPFYSNSIFNYIWDSNTDISWITYLMDDSEAMSSYINKGYDFNLDSCKTLGLVLVGPLSDVDDDSKTLFTINTDRVSNTRGNNYKTISNFCDWEIPSNVYRGLWEDKNRWPIFKCLNYYNLDMSNQFSNSHFYNIKEIGTTNGITNMSHMFYNSVYLQDIEHTLFMNSVTNAENMFGMCYNLSNSMITNFVNWVPNYSQLVNPSTDDFCDYYGLTKYQKAKFQFDDIKEIMNKGYAISNVVLPERNIYVSGTINYNYYTGINSSVNILNTTIEYYTVEDPRNEKTSGQLKILNANPTFNIPNAFYYGSNIKLAIHIDNFLSYHTLTNCIENKVIENI